MQTGRRIAFDYGDVRTGVAVTDISGILATPHSTLATEDPQFLGQIATLLQDLEPIYIVVGKPQHLSGATSAKEASVEQFVLNMRAITQIPIFLIDERLTTVSANRSLKDSGRDSREARRTVDEVAATAILESALNAERLQGVPSKDSR